jgi:hypothetical protein
MPETIAYTEVRSRGAIIFKCEALDTSPFGGIARYAPKELLKKLDAKLAPKLEIFIGMPCRVTYRTDNKYININININSFHEVIQSPSTSSSPFVNFCSQKSC